jgi:hypothetical protein
MKYKVGDVVWFEDKRHTISRVKDNTDNNESSAFSALHYDYQLYEGDGQGVFEPPVYALENQLSLTQ